MCSTCDDKGIIRVTWNDAPDDYAVCLCPIGQAMRSESNAGKLTGYALWQVWAFREQVDPSRVFFLEEVLTPTELAAKGFQKPVETTHATREAALLAGSRRGRARL